MSERPAAVAAGTKWLSSAPSPKLETATIASMTSTSAEPSASRTLLKPTRGAAARSLPWALPGALSGATAASGMGGRERTVASAGSASAAASASRMRTAQRQPNSSVSRPVSGRKTTDEKPPVVTSTVIACTWRCG